MNLSCENARTLIPSYLDDEVSEEQAAPLRQHLLECPDCREFAQDESSVKRWFSGAASHESGHPVDSGVPAGFAERVARRAFAGDPGQLTPEPAGREAAASAESGRILPFVITLTAAAAILLFSLSTAIRFRELPSDQDVGASGQRPYDQLIDELREVNERAEERDRLEDGEDESR